MSELFISDQFEIWKNCKKRYYYKYIKKLYLPENEQNYEVGKSVHALACYYLRNFKIDHLEISVKDEILIHWNAIKSHSILKKQVIATEWAFNTRVRNTSYWLNGRIDAVFYDKTNNEYIIADWKTGQNVPKNPENSFQCKMYLYAFYNAQKDLKLNFAPEQLIFQYIKTPDCEYIEPVRYSEEKNAQYEELFKKLLDEMTSSTYFPKVSDKPEKYCKYCPYKTLCFKS